MRTYLLSLLCMGTLLAGTYDNNYVVTPLANDAMTVEKDPFMNGKFIEIKRFEALEFSDGVLTNDSESSLEKIISILQTYQKNNIIKIKVIGHTSEHVADIKDSKSFAQDITIRLKDATISEDVIFTEYRGSRDLLFLSSSEEIQNLSNRVMLTMYVLEPIDGDSDQDGILDSRDKCPTTPHGVKVSYSGCPFDDDKDRVLNYLDECPNNPIGVKVNDVGCPLDSDEDGVLDYKDKCSGTINGLKVDADGCRIHRELRLNFAHKSSDITSDVYFQVVDFAQFLQENPAYKVQIVGHTDSIGKAGDNMRLSFDRAHSVKAALQKEGVDAKRLEALGRGELSPLETNRTAKGRATNRRIEVKLFN